MTVWLSRAADTPARQAPHGVRRAGVVAAGVLAALLAVLMLPGLPAASAASVCPDASGVVVVVDFRQLGGGIQQHCIAGSGSAASLFGKAGFGLDYVQREPGFVCRVAGKPAADPCVNTPPADAYWGLFWSDGRSGTWSYATTGAQSLSIPSGGYVGFVWQGQAGQVKPGITPEPRAGSPSPSPTAPSSTSGSGASGQTKHKHRKSSSAAPSAAPSSAPSESAPAGAAPSPKPSARAKATQPKQSPTPVSAATEAASERARTATNDPTLEKPRTAGGGAPWWAVLGVAGLLGAAGLWWQRQRSA